MSESADSCTNTLNFNIGVLGHVDSGKTSLSRALSSTASTAAFDKNPQSRERGITLDLGFSSFTVDLPDHLRDSGGQQQYGSLQFTLVDCPGHASLIRTIIGGAQIIDLMMLVVDVVKGVQTQTAECLLIGELTCPRMVVILNKVDLLPPNKRQSAIEKMTKRLHKTLESTRFKECPVIAVAAKPGGPEAPDTEEPHGVPELIELLKKETYLPQREPGGDLLMAVDHCFSIRGQGTVMTGTILQGSLAINDTVEIPALKVTKKIKSVQMFRKPVSGAMQGDRVGVCVTQFDPKLLERGVVCTPGSLRTLYAAVISVRKIGYFKGSLATRAKFHITVGHETVMARVMFFGLPPVDHSEPPSDTQPPPPQPRSLDSPFTFEREYVYQDEYVTGQGEASLGPEPEQWALLEFERPVTCPSLCLVIGSKLDTDIHANACRLAFQGRLLQGFEDKGYAETGLPRLRIYKTKHKEGQVERVTDDYTVIGRNMFKKETSLQLFLGLKVTLSTGETGIVEGGFGQSGKFKIRLQEGLCPETKQLLSSTSKKKGKGGSKGGPTNEEEPKTDSQPVCIHLHFKQFVFDPHKKMVQS
ncbi:selenocysteine-specific elongation factor isoform X1 [Anarrhichthys ocellatus]|uniref:selenocysteine-specific elongation factor isoform X1 n=1 Tax=Anarrhichthys ocellatus TaxID=433405 RepID=UPI0012EE1878|nr:selenocysteine-specific elongation factor isoform X1 [Anarrhichthys ocellatus]